MATLTRRVVRLVAVVGTIPAVGIAVGYRTRTLQADASDSGVRRVYKVSDLPIYSVSATDKTETDHSVSNKKNVVEEQITVARRAVQEFFGQFEDVYDKVRTTTSTGIEHSRATLDYLQNSPGDLPRVAFIAASGLGGIVLGFRGGILRKLTYGSVAAVSCTAICYPKKTVELSYSSIDYLKEQWKENVGVDLVQQYWPFRKDEPSDAQPTTPASETSSDRKPESKEKRPKPKGDLGQSNPEDKDLYSTRSS
jgi:hypothetical protein